MCAQPTFQHLHALSEPKPTTPMLNLHRKVAQTRGWDPPPCAAVRCSTSARHHCLAGQPMWPTHTSVHPYEPLERGANVPPCARTPQVAFFARRRAVAAGPGGAAPGALLALCSARRAPITITSGVLSLLGLTHGGQGQQPGQSREVIAGPGPQVPAGGPLVLVCQA